MTGTISYFIVRGCIWWNRFRLFRRTPWPTYRPLPSRKSGKCYNKQNLYSVYQHDNIFPILAKEQHRNKINNLSDSQLFVFHLVSSLGLGRIQSAS